MYAKCTPLFPTAIAIVFISYVDFTVDIHFLGVQKVSTIAVQNHKGNYNRICGPHFFLTIFNLSSRVLLIIFQLCGFALRRDQGLQQVRGLPAGRQLRGQPFPELLERGLRGRRLEVRPVQLGRQTSRQRQGSPQARKDKVRQLEVSQKQYVPTYIV